MDHAARVAFVAAQTVCAQAKLMGMAAANAQTPNDQPYTYDDFMAVPDEFQIGWNTVIAYLRDG